ncbi:CD63 antigen-like [Tubulanus polymorphus]|uniref:CD63 antigen-like n=1 Tax=Tubulanus polymorphus TaxID=672921 RepID=UPI003DA26C0F
MVEGGMKCVKFLLFAFNLLFFLAGLGLIIAGAIIQSKFSEFLKFFEETSFNSVAVLLIVLGCIVFIIGFFGCCGAVKENYCMVMTFAVLMGLIFIIEIGAGIAAFVMKSNVEKQVRKGMSDTLGQYWKNPSVKKTWDGVQKTFKCCGVDGPKDWKKTNGTTTGNIPVSCCKTNTNDPKCVETANNVYTSGCVKGFKDWVEDNIYIVAGVGVGLAFVQVIGVIFACCLARSIKKEYEVV